MTVLQPCSEIPVGCGCCLLSYAIAMHGGGSAAAFRFFAEDDDVCARDWLAATAAEHGCAIHADVLMTNPMHLRVTRGATHSLSRTMASLGRLPSATSMRVRRTMIVW
jgi:hypothetical protein